MTTKSHIIDYKGHKIIMLNYQYYLSTNSAKRFNSMDLAKAEVDRIEQEADALLNKILSE